MLFFAFLFGAGALWPWPFTLGALLFHRAAGTDVNAGSIDPGLAFAIDQVILHVPR